MAANARDYGWIRKNGRLESFLQKCLAQEYCQVSWYEPCVVSSSYDKQPTFRFVVVTDEHVYVTDNPPTELILIVHLGDVVRLEVINEYPEFLKGAERENVQHIKITSKEEDGEVPLSLTGSLSQMSDISYREDAGSRASIRSAEGSSASDPGPESKSRKKWNWSRFLSSLLLSRRKCGLQPVAEDDHQESIHESDVTIASDDVNIKKHRKSIFKKLLLFSRYKVRSELETDRSSIVSPIEDNFLGNDLRNHSFLHVTDHKRPISVPPVSQQLLSPGDHDVTLQLRSPSGRAQTALGNYADHLFLIKKHDYRRSLSDNSEDSTNKSKKSPKHPSELHLYILTAQSAIFRHLIAAWNRILVKLTIRLENDQIYFNKGSNREHFDQILLDVYRKLNAINQDDMAQLRVLMDNFQAELTRSSLARKLFWKDPHLFPTIVERLRILVVTPNHLKTFTVGEIMDKLKLASSIIMVLSMALQETQTLPERNRHLTNKAAQRTQELLTILISEPWIPANYQNIVQNIITSHEQLLSEEWEMLPEAPLIRSLIELTNTSTAALYQFVQLAYQEKELTTNQKTYNIPWRIFLQDLCARF
ncbi:uncharacterized protein C12orf56-like isoform X2 [Centruroides vittatus]|uniref:uncharacterized protein C12orf56-like isoform X2 n=1 Tax=Centruroides vittatus TaxID=120091 RepID=UPI00351088C5